MTAKKYVRDDILRFIVPYIDVSQYSLKNAATVRKLEKYLLTDRDSLIRIPLKITNWLYPKPEMNNQKTVCEEKKK